MQHPNIQVPLINAPALPQLNLTANHVTRFSVYATQAKRAKLENRNVITNIQYADILVQEQRVIIIKNI
jgi:hypothetical protein